MRHSFQVNLNLSVVNSTRWKSYRVLDIGAVNPSCDNDEHLSKRTDVFGSDGWMQSIVSVVVEVLFHDSSDSCILTTV